MTAIDLDAIRERSVKYLGLGDRLDAGCLPNLNGSASATAIGLAASLTAADVPDLLAEIDRLRADNARLRRLAACCQEEPGHDGPCTWDCSVCSGEGKCPDCDPRGIDRCGTCEGSGACSGGCADGRFVQSHNGEPVATVRAVGGRL